MVDTELKIKNATLDHRVELLERAVKELSEVQAENVIRHATNAAKVKVIIWAGSAIWAVGVVVVGFSLHG